MRHVRNPQMNRAEMGINLKSREVIAVLLPGLWHLHAGEEVCDR